VIGADDEQFAVLTELLNRACRLIAALACASCVCTADAGAGEIFRWTDEQGNLHFTSDPNQVPARYRGQSQPAVFDGNIIVAEDGDAASAKARLEALKQREQELEQERREAAARAKRSAGRARDPGPEPQKYTYDCVHRTRNGRCRRHRTAAWERWDKLRQQSEAAD
jgi:hypothetical protein